MYMYLSSLTIVSIIFYCEVLAGKLLVLVNTLTDVLFCPPFTLLIPNDTRYTIKIRVVIAPHTIPAYKNPIPNIANSICKIPSDVDGIIPFIIIAHNINNAQVMIKNILKSVENNL